MRAWGSAVRRVRVQVEESARETLLHAPLREAAHSPVRTRARSQLAGIVASPTTADEHAANFDVVLTAITDDERVRAEGLSLEVKGLSAKSLAEGDLHALNDLAGLFSVLCNALLQTGQVGDPSHALVTAQAPSAAQRRGRTHGWVAGGWADRLSSLLLHRCRRRSCRLVARSLAHARAHPIASRCHRPRCCC